MANQVNIAIDYSSGAAPTGTDLGEVSPFAPVGKNGTLLVPAAIPASTAVSVQTNSVETAGDANWTTQLLLVTGNTGLFNVPGLQRYVRFLVTDTGTGTSVWSLQGVL